MGFIGSVKTCLRKSFDFTGHSKRSELLWFYLFVGICCITASVFDDFFFRTGSGFGPIYCVVAILLFVPQLAVGARRLHDIGKTGWWQIVPFELHALTYLLYQYLNLSTPAKGIVDLIFPVIVLIIGLSGVVIQVLIFIWYILPAKTSGDERLDDMNIRLNSGKHMQRAL